MDGKKLILNTKLFLFDMDGTLYLGEQLFDFTRELLEVIRKGGRRAMFMTNNSSKSVTDYIKKLNRLGIPAQEADFITSAQATAWYLKKQHPGKRLYVCGTQSLKRELEAEGFPVTDQLSAVEVIVMGFDTELTFQKLDDVSKLLSTRPDIPYIATHPDLVCPTEYGSVPDCGSVCEMIYHATKKRPIVIGKPEALMPQLAMERMNCGKEETAVIGDRIYTDVKSGLNAGVTAVLVLSGETTREILEQSPDKPHLVLEDAGQILEILKAEQR